MAADDRQKYAGGTIYRASGLVLTGFGGGDVLELADDLAELNGGKFAPRPKPRRFIG